MLVEGGATQRLAGSAVGFADAGEHALKGKAEPVQLWRATRVLSGVGGSQRVDGLEAPLTGRDAELRTVRDLFHAAADRRVPRMVLVSGPAGVGKSRLDWEFFKYIDGLEGDGVVSTGAGACHTGRGVAFWALAEIVRQRLGIAEEDPAETAAAKLADGLARYVADPAERRYVGARLGRLLGVAAEGDDGSGLSREELFAGWRLFFERLAAENPVVLLVEDAQYADAGLLDFLDHLIDWGQDLPVYVMVFARPELGQARPEFGVGRNRSTLTLDPLDPGSMETLVDALVPGMPHSARAAVTRQAQGIPLFAVETVRSLIDRDIVQPIEGAYRLVGDVGELAVPDSLHALLAARLDALDPDMRRLVADAAVLGTTFPAEALVAVSGQDETTVRAALAELVRREVLTVSADRLSPERGSYRFTQDMLRQVAYDTLSRRDRKTRHLTVAAHLRTAFPGDGEEVAEVIARHYRDALEAVPGDPDTAEIRRQAISALVRAGERAERTGAPARAAASYAAAADLILADPPGAAGTAGPSSAGLLWERAANAADTSANWAQAVELAGRARDYHWQAGQARAAARAQAIAGQALRYWGRLAEAREQLTTSVEVLRADPDTDTVHALANLATVEVFAGSPGADRLSAEALSLGQALAVGDGELSRLFSTRGIYFASTDRRADAAAYWRESARLAEQASDSLRLGLALLNLADTLTPTDPGAAAETAQAAAGYARRVGDRDSLAYAIGNLAGALLMLGDWDGAEKELTQAADSGALAGYDFLACYQGWLAALRGDTAAAQATLAGLAGLPGSEDPQDQAMVSLVEGFTAAARRQPRPALGHVRAALAHAGALGISHEALRWAWPLAARASDELRDTAATGELLTLLDDHQPGHLAPMLRAERDLAHARLADARLADARPADARLADARLVDDDGGQDAAVAFAAAISSLREQSTPYHLAHGLLDHAAHLLRTDEDEAAAAAISEAADIGERLRCRPLLDRADTFQPARPRTAAS